MGWWRFVRLSLDALVEPAEVAECDRAMEELARDSRVGGALHRLSWTIRSAWRQSSTRTFTTTLATQLGPIGVRGWLLVVAGATALALNAVKPIPNGPLSSFLPSLVIVAGALIMLMAGPLARAISNKTS